MALTSSNIEMRLTGGSSNTDPNLSLGGNVSTTKVNPSSLHNLFRRITESEASSGVTLYRCVAIKNNASEIMRNVVFYMVLDTKSADDQALYSFAQVGKNAVETAIANEFTTPTGSNIDFIAALKRTAGLKLGDLAAGDFRCVWLRVTVNPGAETFADNFFRVRAEVNPSTTSEPSVPSPNPDTGSNFSMAALADMSCNSEFQSNFNKIKGRNTGFIIFGGDNAYKSGSQCWLDITSSYRSKSGTAFGNHDVDESESQPETKNALKNAYGYGATYNKKTFNNVGIVFLESGENQSVSDSVGSNQYNFIESSLKSYSENPAIEWIIVCNHYNIYGPPSDHGNNTGGRDRYDPLFDKYGVDIVITGHNHNMWQSKLIKYNSGSPGNPTIIGTDPNYSYSKAADNHGKMWIGAGAGGRALDSIDSNPSYIAWSNGSNYGYVFFEFSNSGKKVTIRFYTNSNNLLKTATITHT